MRTAKTSQYLASIWHSGNFSAGFYDARQIYFTVAIIITYAYTEEYIVCNIEFEQEDETFPL